jgi:hypothetical protein
MVSLGDRSLVIKLPTDGQLAMLAFHTNTVKKAATGGALTGEAVEALGHFINILGYLFNEGDRAYVVDGLSSGEFTISDVMDLLSAFKNGGEGSGAKPAKAVRRTR